MTPDVVETILAPYSPCFCLWSKDGTSYRQGDHAGPVGLAKTYAVRLHGPDDAAPRFLWVQDGVLTNPMAHQPIAQAAVFDAWGRYLGRGGESLSAPGRGPVNSLATAVPADAVEPPSEAPPTKPRAAAPKASPRKATFSHTFRLRAAFQVTLDLPNDLTEREANRLAAWVRSLALGDPRP